MDHSGIQRITPVSIRQQGHPPLPSAPAVLRQSAPTDFDDQTGGTPSGVAQLVEVSGSDTVDEAKVENNFATLATQLNELIAKLKAAGILV